MEMAVFGAKCKCAFAGLRAIQINGKPKTPMYGKFKCTGVGAVNDL